MRLEYSLDLFMASAADLASGYCPHSGFQYWSCGSVPGLLPAPATPSLGKQKVGVRVDPPIRVCRASEAGRRSSAIQLREQR